MYFMSIVNSFDISTNAILEPRCLVSPIENFPKTVILTFKKEIIKALLDNYDVEKID